MGDCVESLAEVKVDNIHGSPFIYPARSTFIYPAKSPLLNYLRSIKEAAQFLT